MVLQRADGSVLSLSMEALQNAYILALASASGCEVAVPGPDTSKTDLVVSHSWSGHTGDSIATIRVQLKATYQRRAHKQAYGRKYSVSNPTFSFSLDNETFVKLAEPAVTLPRLLFVMILPESPDDWTTMSATHLQLAHHCYYVSIRGKKTTGAQKSTVVVPLANKLDAQSLNELMLRIGKGGFE
jgi:hypothetical protein